MRDRDRVKCALRHDESLKHGSRKGDEDGRYSAGSERQRTAACARIKWMFTTDKARAKMGRAYPDTSKES